MKFATILASTLALTALAADDMNKSMEELCLENGFRSEQHTVVTDDGYVLSLYRIPGKFTDNLSVKKPAVLMVHA
jgi:lysosomal acid lipase/cholesteryl ester hydrolase